MGRLCQNVRRRHGVYWFTKKTNTPAGVRTLEFSLSVREPELATMIGAQVNAQFHLFRAQLMSGDLEFDTFRTALMELASTVAQSRRRKMFETLTRTSETREAEPLDLPTLVRADVTLGRVMQIVAEHGSDLFDANVFVEVLDGAGFTDEEIAVLLGGFYPLLPDLLELRTNADAPKPVADALVSLGRAAEGRIQPFVHRAVLRTVGQTMGMAANAAAQSQLVGTESLVEQAVNRLYSAPLPAPSPVSAPVQPPAPAPTPHADVRPRPAAPITDVENHPFLVAARALLEREKKCGRDAKDILTISRLFSEFLIEKQVYEREALRQEHFADFEKIFEDLPTSWGKSSGETCLAKYRERGKTLPKDKRGIQAKTWNKHIANLGRVLRSQVARGAAFGVPGEILDPGLLRIKIGERERELRDPFEIQDLEALFKLPVFTGCAGWERRRPFEAGAHIYHRALYFAPMLLYYTGARRDEICGLACEDVFLDEPTPYIHIRANAQRRIKNAQSARCIPIHSEILRLGFDRYVREIRRLGHRLLFPDLYSKTTSSPLGDRFYDEIAGALAATVPEEGQRKKVIHSLRHTVGGVLKEGGIVSEFRADLLGHKGKTVTSETYSKPASVKALKKLIEKLPSVTSHLQPAADIKLVPWVAQKKPAPWGRAPRKSARAAQLG